MCFVNRVALDDYIIRINDGFCRVCYSFHSSYSEIRDAILFLRPKRAFPNVVASYQDGEDEQKVSISVGVCNSFATVECKLTANVWNHCQSLVTAHISYSKVELDCNFMYEILSY